MPATSLAVLCNRRTVILALATASMAVLAALTFSDAASARVLCSIDATAACGPSSATPSSPSDLVGPVNLFQDGDGTFECFATSSGMCLTEAEVAQVLAQIADPDIGDFVDGLLTSKYQETADQIFAADEEALLHSIVEACTRSITNNIMGTDGPCTGFDLSSSIYSICGYPFAPPCPDNSDEAIDRVAADLVGTGAIDALIRTCQTTDDGGSRACDAVAHTVDGDHICGEAGRWVILLCNPYREDRLPDVGAVDVIGVDIALPEECEIVEITVTCTGAPAGTAAQQLSANS